MRTAAAVTGGLGQIGTPFSKTFSRVRTEKSWKYLSPPVPTCLFYPENEQV